jgi:hypothetical protein
MRWKSYVVALAVVLAGSVAKADDELPAGAEPKYGEMPMASEGRNPRLERRLSLQTRHRQDRTYRGPAGILGLQGGVPILVGSGVDEDVGRVGGSILGFGGVDFGFGAIELGFGYMGIPTNPDPFGSVTSQRLALDIGGRVQVPNRSSVIPFLGFGFAAQWWKYSLPVDGCASVFCSTGGKFRFAPGFNVRAGLSILLGNLAAIELGARYNISFEANGVSNGNIQFVEPTLGFRFWI